MPDLASEHPAKHLPPSWRLVTFGVFPGGPGHTPSARCDHMLSRHLVEPVRLTSSPCGVLAEAVPILIVSPYLL